MPRDPQVTQYYKTLTAVPISDVARDLLGSRITEASAHRLECDCPHHQSTSKRSLHVFLDTNSWRCWGCQVGGDVLHLVEFIQSGQCTTKMRGSMTESHKAARDYLASRCGLKPLGAHRKSEAEIKAMEEAYFHKEQCLTALAAIAELFHRRLLENARALGWIRENYGLTMETITDLKIGIANLSSQETIEQLHTEFGIERRDAIRTGAFWLTENKMAKSLLKDRVTFPYWRGGRIVSMIGRKTPWSKKDTMGKYLKLLVHDPKKRPYVDPCMDNSTFYNEDCLLRKPEQVLITEGVTDCIAAMQQGLAVISPVTVGFPKRDVARLAEALAHVKHVFICQDNELSRVGLSGAIMTATLLEEKHIDARIVTLPLGRKQRDARDQLLKDFGIGPDSDPRNLKASLRDPSEEDLATVKRLIADAKIDLNGYFTLGYTAEEFQELLAEAKSPIEIKIAQLDITLDDKQRFKQRQPLMVEIAKLPEYLKEKCLKLIQQRYGKKAITLKALRSELRAGSKAAKAEKKSGDQRQQLATQLQAVKEGSCQEAMLKYRLAADDPSRVTNEELGQVVYQWFKENGAKFFYTQHEEPFVYFQNEILESGSRNVGRRRSYLSVFQKHTGLTKESSSGRVILETLRNLAREEGVQVANLAWIYSQTDTFTVYFNLNNDANEIACISPDGVRLLKNGDNPKGIVLRESDKMRPIQFIPDADPVEAAKLVDRIIMQNMTCAAHDRKFVMAWLSCFLLIDFAGTRPMTRFEGKQGSGKSAAGKMITTLIYGDPQLRTSTTPADYADAARNPLCALDNVEVKNVDTEKNQFFLLATTQAVREKIAIGTNSDVVKTPTKCLINTTGIEPLGAELGEIQTRLFTIEFDEAHGRSGFIEFSVLNEIRKHRDYILSALMIRTAGVLALIKAGWHQAAVELLENRLGNHNKKRCHDYLSLMYLMIICIEEPEEIVAALQTLRESFSFMIERLNEVTEETEADGNQIALGLSILFQAYRKALEADEARQTKDSSASFGERYLISFHSPFRIKKVLAKELLVSLQRVFKDFTGKPFGIQNARQLGHRLLNDRKAIEAAGFQLERVKGSGNRYRYTIEQVAFDEEMDAVEEAAENPERQSNEALVVAMTR
ncbi:Toprim-N domain-containing protein [Sulfidibacter corallicola]|uniref:DNA primase n=1 Tax=Sulfidibacter corallicola TaxID=2818388 RepID=A0A8A4TW48_SULCO|nr:hypothetical protein [Sulfidibacter corallicola]QTD54169.1 hypothetical protein J3U87_17120 [Sulfidibacter corallicola]